MQTSPSSHRRAVNPRPARGLLALLVLALAAAPSLHAQNGVWTNLVNGDASGSWATAANWANGISANGTDNTADFSTLDFTNNSTVTLDGAWTIGGLIFGDTTPSANWTLNNGSGGPLTLAVSAGSPSILVSNQTATIGATLAGANGFIAPGAGTLVLNNTANSGLTGNITVSNGTLVAAANTGALGAASDGSGGNVLTVADGATLQLNPNVQINNKQLFLTGTGIGGTNGAFHVNATGTSNGTRWGIGGSTALDPFVTLEGDATIRVDGDSSGAGAAVFLLRSINIGTNTLTKTGAGRLNFDQQNRVSGDGLVHVMEGGLGFRAGGFSGARSLTVDAGAEARVTGDNGALNSTANTVTINGKLDLNARGNGNVGSDTTSFSQTIGLLFGSGTITSGTFGNTGTQTLTLNHDATTNSQFAGTITQANGTVNLVQAGANALTLSGTNTYRGSTTINAGTLLVNGAYAGGGGFMVNAGGTLGGTGSVSAFITNSGTIMAGDPSSPGATLTVNSNIFGSFSDTIAISNATLAANAVIGANSQTVGTLYMTNGTLQIPLPTAGPTVFVSALNVDGDATIEFSTGTPVKGQFPIISYGSIGGLAGFAGLLLISPPGVTAVLSNNVANSTIDVVITGLPALTWAGTPNGDWDIGATANWQGGLTYTESGGAGPYVIFDDTASGTTTVNLTTTLSPKGVTVNNNTLNYTFTGGGHLSGAGGILKQGAGTLTVTTGGNDFSGGLVLQQGAVQVGNGGTSGDLGSGPIANSGTLALNRSDSFALANTVSGNGAITKAGAGAATVPVSGDSAGAVTVSGGALLLGPTGSSTFSGDVTGAGAFGVSGPGTLILNGLNDTYGGGTVISNGTLQFGDALGNGALPPAGAVSDNGTLATPLSGTLANNISGSGGLAILSNAVVTLSGNNSYSGPTLVSGPSGSTLNATAASFPAASVLMLGDQTTGSGAIGSAYFTAGNPVIGGLNVGGNIASANLVNLSGSGQTLTVAGNVSVGAVIPEGATVLLQASGTGASLVVNTNGGVIQIGLGASGSGVNPDNVLVDFSAIDNFIAKLGTNGVFNMGTLDGNPGPPSGATVVNQLNLANVSNSITAGTLTIGAGGRQLTPDLRLGPGTNILDVGTLNIGTGGRDGGQMEFNNGTGGLTVRGAAGGSSRASYNQGVNLTTGTGAPFTTTVDLSGGAADLRFGPMVIGNEPVRAGGWDNTFTFSQGVLDATSVSLSQGCRSGTTGSSTMNINGGAATLGAVSLTASPAAGTLNIAGGTVTVSSITGPGSGGSTLSVGNATLNLSLAGFGNPTTAPVAVNAFSVNGPVNLGVSGAGLAAGQFPLISYSGSIGGSGFSALSLASLPSGVSGFLSNNVANSSVDLVITVAPPAVNPNPTNLTVGVSGQTLSLSWPPDHQGWTLLTNAVALTATNAWFPYPGSASVTNVAIPIDSARTNVFFRLAYPYP